MNLFISNELYLSPGSSNRILMIHGGIEHISGNTFDNIPSADAIFMKVRNTLLFYINSFIIFTLDLSTEGISTLFTKFTMDFSMKAFST